MTIGMGMDKQHAASVITTVLSLALLAGSMLAGAVWYLASDINAVAVADSQALAKESQLFQDSLAKQGQIFEDAHMMMAQRVTTLEAERSEDHTGIEHLSSAVDQERAAITDLTTAVIKLQAAVDARQPTRR